MPKGKAINSLAKYGTLNDRDIKAACTNGELYISPFEEKNLTALGYNLKPSAFVISTRTGLPLLVKKKHSERFVWVHPHETILVTTKESVFVGPQIFGTFHSKVKLVSQGFSHISTTLDPLWNGPLLFAITNTSSKKRKFVLEDISGATTVVTVVFYRFQSNVVKIHDNPPCRMDVLEHYVKTPHIIDVAHWFKSFRIYRKFIVELQLSAQTEINLDACESEDLKNLNILMTVTKLQLQCPDEFDFSIFAEFEDFAQKQFIAPSLNCLLIEETAKLHRQLRKYKTAVHPKKRQAEVMMQSVENLQCQIIREARAMLWRRIYAESAQYLYVDSLTNRFVYCIISGIIIKGISLLSVAGFVGWLIYHNFENIQNSIYALSESAIATIFAAIIATLITGLGAILLKRN